MSGIGSKIKEKLHLGRRKHTSDATEAQPSETASSQAAGSVSSNSNHSSQQQATPHAQQSTSAADALAAAIPIDRESAGYQEGRSAAQPAASVGVKTGPANTNSTVDPALTQAQGAGGRTFEDVRSSVHTTADERGTGFIDSLGPKSSENWERAQELTRKAAEEGALAEREQREAVVRLHESEFFKKEAESAFYQYETAFQKLREAEAIQAVVPGKEREVAAIESDATHAAKTHENLLSEFRQLAEAARARWEAADKAAKDAIRREQIASDWAQRLAQGKQAVIDADERAKQLAAETTQVASMREAQMGDVATAEAAVAEARTLVEGKRRELAQAEELLAANEAVLQRALDSVRQTEEMAHQKKTHNEGQSKAAIEARQQLAVIQDKLSVAQFEAAEAAELARKKAALAQTTEQEAVAHNQAVVGAQHTAEQAAAVAMERKQSLQAAIARAEAVAPAIPKHREAAEYYQDLAQKQHTAAHEKVEEYKTYQERTEIHRGRWSEYWEEAKRAGEEGNRDYTNRFENMRAKLMSVVPDGLKGAVANTKHDLSQNHEVTQHTVDEEQRTEQGPTGKHDEVAPPGGLRQATPAGMQKM